MSLLLPLPEAQQILKSGGVLAYPTEAVYGLGCAAFNESAIKRILTIKQRDLFKGFIVLIHHWQQLEALIAPIADVYLEKVRATWPGPVTWLFPKASHIPPYLSGDHASIAIRMSNHPIARALCEEMPIVSTSANRSGELPIVDSAFLLSELGHEIDGLVEGELGDQANPTMIIDVITGQRLR